MMLVIHNTFYEFQGLEAHACDEFEIAIMNMIIAMNLTACQLDRLGCCTWFMCILNLSPRSESMCLHHCRVIFMA